MRSYITFVGIIIYTAVVATLAIIIGLFDPTGNIVFFISRIWAWLILKTAGIKVDIEGFDKLDKNRSYIFMSNHISHIDTAAIVVKSPLELRFFAKKELLKIPVFGLAVYLGRHVIINRKNIILARKSIEQARRRMLKYGFSIILFPEGTRSTTGKIGPFKKGGFVLAIESGFSIVPIGIKGSFEILPSHSLLVKSGTIRVKIGKPIQVDQYNMDNKEVLIDRVKAEIENLSS